MRYALILLLTALGLLSAALTHAAAPPSLDFIVFRQLPVLEDGRLKPLDSFATHLAVRLSGRETIGDRPAIEWLAITLFDPAAAGQLPAFRIRNPHVRAMFVLPERQDKRYTLAEIAPGLATSAAQVGELVQRPADSLSHDEQDLIDLHASVLLYNQVLQAFSLLLPLPVPPPAGLNLPDGATYLDAQKIEPALAERVRGFLTPEKIEQPELLSTGERELAGFLHTLQELRQGGENSRLLRLIPPGWQDADGDWLSPWQLLLSGQGSPQGVQLLGVWQRLATAYRQNNADAWHKASLELLASAADSTPGLRTRLLLEVEYRDWRPYDWALGMFALAALVSFAALRARRPATAGWWITTAGTLLLAGAVACRIFILQRPPVGTLHESVLFVALVVAISALIVTRKNRLPALLLGAGLGGMLLLTIAPLVQQDSENMTMLSAVLNTNFWLTVHVLCITAGYGACLLTALLAHVMLATSQTRHDLSAWRDLLHRLGLIALLLTATGTLLGGVWADQSWGRFWGWDPKENGALVIVLWLIWLQHGRLAGQMREVTYTAGLAALAVVVAQAWFGVNLLGTGLHSYGFIKGIALSLFAFTAADLTLIASLWALAVRRTGRGIHAA